jgi:hypothetical protein
MTVILSQCLPSLVRLLDDLITVSSLVKITRLGLRSVRQQVEWVTAGTTSGNLLLGGLAKFVGTISKFTFEFLSMLVKGGML